MSRIISHFTVNIMGLRAQALLLIVTALPMLSAHAALKTDLGKSSVSATFKQMNVPLDGKFKKFTATIDFSATKLESSKAAVEIDMSGFDLGDPEFNKEVLKKEWFHAAQYPRASFTSTSIKPTAGGKFEVQGKLTMKGKVIDVAFPLSVKSEAGGLTFDGTLPIKRLSFNIGEGDWKDTSMVADEVVIKFHIVTTP